MRTPPTSAAILAGITRDTAITLLREQGVDVREEMIARDELYTADEVFLTGTAAEITPVREIDHRKIGRGEAGRSPVASRSRSSRSSRATTPSTTTGCTGSEAAAQSATYGGIATDTSAVCCAGAAVSVTGLHVAGSSSPWRSRYVMAWGPAASLGNADTHTV